MKVSLRSTGELLPHPQELPKQVLSFLKRYPDTCGQGLDLMRILADVIAQMFAH